MSDVRPIVPLTLLGAAAPACDGDDCLLPAAEGATPPAGGSSPGGLTTD